MPPSTVADCGSEELFMDMLLQNFPRSTTSYDAITMVMILAPSFVAVVCEEKVHPPTVISNLVTLVLVAWVVRFLSMWPLKWVSHLKLVRTSLLNFVNSVKIEIGQAFYLPEMALNRRVFVSNLVVAQRLLYLEKMAWLGGIIATFVGALLMLLTRRYLIASATYNSEVFGNASLILFVVWNLFKLALQYLDSLKDSITFAKTATVENSVNENNLLYYIEMFCLESPVELPTMSPKKPKDLAKPKVEPPKSPAFSPKKLNVRRPKKLSGVNLKKAGKPPAQVRFEPLEKQEGNEKRKEGTESQKKESFEPKDSVSITPFPLNASLTSFRRRLAERVQEDLSLLSPIAEDLEDTEKSTEPPQTPQNHGRVSVTGVAVPEAPNPSVTRLKFRQLHISNMESQTPLQSLTPSPTLPLLPLRVYKPDESSDDVIGRMKKFTDLHSQKVQDDWNEVRGRLTDFKESCYQLAWDCAEKLGQIDLSVVSMFWFIVNVCFFVPIRMAFSLTMLFFRLPFMIARLYISAMLFIPLIIFKASILAPARLIINFVRDENRELGFQEYRMTHSLPLLKDRVTMKLLRKFLRLMKVEVDDTQRTTTPTPVELRLMGE